MPAKKDRGTVAVQIGGKIYTASFTVHDDSVTVTVPNGNYASAEIGKLTSAQAAEAVLLELVRDGRAG